VQREPLREIELLQVIKLSRVLSGRISNSLIGSMARLDAARRQQRCGEAHQLKNVRFGLVRVASMRERMWARMRVEI
jgi:hypothetical protein